MTPMAPSLRPTLLPAIVTKMALGARVTRSGVSYTVTLEGDAVELHEQDFELAARAARRLVASSEKLSSPGEIVSAVEQARRYVCEEVFRPDAVHVLFMPSATLGSLFYRCQQPISTLNRGNRVVAHMRRPGTPIRQALDYDVSVIQIAHDDSTLLEIKALQAAGRKVVYEMDDAFDCMAPWHPGHEYYSRKDVQDRIFEIMGLVDLVTVSTEWLKDRYAPSCKRIEVVPNRVNIGYWPKTRAKKDGIFRILWAGSPSHDGDLDVVSEALEDFIDGDEDVKVIFFGSVPPDIRIPEQRIETIPFVGFDRYPDILAEVGADVAIAPLSDIPFNHGKSPIKVIEYMATGYPVIASNVGPYRLIENGRTGILCDTKQDWIRAFERTLREKDLCDTLSSNAAAFVRQHDVDSNRRVIEEMYVSLGRTL